MSDDTITRIPLDTDAHRQGYLAGRRGNADEVNPYQPGTREALAWAIGHVDGQTKRLRIIRSDRARDVFLRRGPPCARTPVAPSHTPSRTTRRKGDERAGRDHHGA